MSERRIAMVIDSDLEHVPLIGIAAQAIFRDAELSDLEAYHLELCLVEAVTNAIKHAYHGKVGHEVRVCLSVDAQRFVITVEDEGTAMQPSVPPPRLDYDPDDIMDLPEGGMGRYIMHTLMDRVEYSSGGGRNALRLEKRRV